MAIFEYMVNHRACASDPWFSFSSGMTPDHLLAKTPFLVQHPSLMAKRDVEGCVTGTEILGEMTLNSATHMYNNVLATRQGMPSWHRLLSNTLCLSALLEYVCLVRRHYK